VVEWHERVSLSSTFLKLSSHRPDAAMDMGYPLHLIDLLAKLYRKQLAKVIVAGTLEEWFCVKKGVRLSFLRTY